MDLLGNWILTLEIEHEHRINERGCVGEIVDFKEVEMG